MPQPYIDLFLRQDGFYAGRQLKNGSLGKGAKRIEESEILTMFAQLLSAYHAKTGNDALTMKDGNGRIIVAKYLPTEIGK